MRRRVGLIAGIGPQTHVLMSMADLRAGCEAEGLAEARTILATGNVVFLSDAPEAALVAALARVLAQHGVDRAAYVRDHADLAGLAGANPFAEAAAERPSNLLVHFMAGPCKAEPDWDGPERIAVSGREAFIDYAGGIGRSRLSTPALARLLGQPGTARNWNTVRRLAAEVAA